MVSPPKYWKDKHTNQTTIKMFCISERTAYKIDAKRLQQIRIMKDMRIDNATHRIKVGKYGGRLEVRYDGLSNRWLVCTQIPVEIKNSRRSIVNQEKDC